MSRWSDIDAQAMCKTFPQVPADVGLRVYSSRLLGRDPSLVLHGGGNTSVKTWITDDLGDDIEVLCVKGSGWDLANIEPAGLPAVALAPLLQLRQLASLSDEAMVRNTRRHLLDPAAPNPSVETLLHAFLPHKFIDHTHADAILALADQADAAERIRQLFGDRVGIVPYIMPGFQLAKLAAEVYESNPDVIGLVLINHGIFTFGDTAKEAYQRMIDLVEKASAAIPGHTAAPVAELQTLNHQHAQWLAQLRGALIQHPQGPGHQVLHLRRSPKIDAFLGRTDLKDVASRGPATPDHIIRTKQMPLILAPKLNRSTPAFQQHLAKEIEGFVTNYQAYFQKQVAQKGVDPSALHPLPIVFLLPGLGLVTAGKNHKSARIAADIYEHTITVIEHAERVGRYQPLGPSDLFDMEYWSLEQAKLGKKKLPMLAGKVAVISGATGGLGEALVRGLAEVGCHLLVTDLDAKRLQKLAKEVRSEYGVTVMPFAGDLTLAETATAIMDQACWVFGGIDFVICNAGKAFTGSIAEATSLLQESLQINLMAQQHLSAAAVTVMQRQGCGGCLLFTSSKAAFNPGTGFGPYNIAKAALVALMKQYALEYAKDGIRSLAVNPDRVRTSLFDQELLANRAAARGLTTDEYFRANLLGQEVLAKDVADACLFLLQAGKSTGTYLTVDGGNLAASPR